MDYRAVYREVCRLAAEHLYSLEIYDEFDEGDADRVDKAIAELQGVLIRKSQGKRTKKQIHADLTAEALAQRAEDWREYTTTVLQGLGRP